MTKTVSGNSRELPDVIGARQDFKTYGSLRGENGRFSSWDAGRLSGDDLDEFRSDLPHISYIVFSYATPIAWVAGPKVYHVKQRFSVTTSKHQGKTYRLR